MFGTNTGSNNDTLKRRLDKVVSASQHTIGTGFSALHFSEEMFDGQMDPLLMVDHFVMTKPTFAPHLHAGISAVTAMFEDSTGGFLNRDTLGHNVTLKAGDLYWLAAASGAAHEETPEANARTHALQIFVNLPARLKQQPARALHIRSQDVPVLKTPTSRVRVLLGSSGEVQGASGTPQEMTILDGTLQANGSFTHKLPEDRQAWVYAVSGNLVVRGESEIQILAKGQATTVDAGQAIDLVLMAEQPAHFVLMAGKPINESFVKHGPLVMSTIDDVRTTLAGYAAGQFGRVPG